ncbi:MAG: hypothetical protein ACK5BN_00385 [Planctomycetota bacterium]
MRHRNLMDSLLLHAAAFSIGFAAGLPAQEPNAVATPAAAEPSAAAMDEQQRLHDAQMPKCFLRGVELRVPSEMRDSEPQLLGLEEAGIAFRDRTPALAEGAITPTIVDPEQLRQQRLAAYARPWSPFSASAEASRADRGTTGSAPSPGVRAVAARAGGGGWGWTLALALALGGGGFVFLRRRQQA